MQTFNGNPVILSSLLIKNIKHPRKKVNIEKAWGHFLIFFIKQDVNTV